MSVQQTNDRTINFNGKLVEFDIPIFEILIAKDKAIILFDADEYKLGDEMVGQNIVAYSETGKLLWRVEPTGIRYPNEDDEIAEFGPDAPETFFDIRLDEVGQLWAGTPGAEVLIDIESGEILDAEQSW